MTGVEVAGLGTAPPLGSGEIPENTRVVVVTRGDGEVERILVGLGLGVWMARFIVLFTPELDVRLTGDMIGIFWELTTVLLVDGELNTDPAVTTGTPEVDTSEDNLEDNLEASVVEVTFVATGLLCNVTDVLIAVTTSDENSDRHRWGRSLTFLTRKRRPRFHRLLTRFNSCFCSASCHSIRTCSNGTTWCAVGRTYNF